MGEDLERKNMVIIHLKCKIVLNNKNAIYLFIYLYIILQPYDPVIWPLVSKTTIECLHIYIYASLFTTELKQILIN